MRCRGGKGPEVQSVEVQWCMCRCRGVQSAEVQVQVQVQEKGGAEMQIWR